MNKKISFIIIGLFIILSTALFILSNRTPNIFSSNASLPMAAPTTIVDLKDGDIYDLTAEMVRKNIGNRDVRMLAYNGSIPGPTIHVSKGAKITLRFTNKTDIPTTIHSHGVRLANAFDGVPDVTQKEIKPGDSFTYTIKFPDEGVYWYHPHLREDYAQELGLYGNFIVTPDSPDYWSPVNKEWVVVLDDILIENGTINLDRETVDHTLMGRFGNIMLVNGETNPQFSAHMGDVVRLYITNAANARTFNIRIPGVHMKLVGGDNGKYETEEQVESVILAPSERAVVEVFFDKTGNPRIEHATPERIYPLATVDVDGTVTMNYRSQFEALRNNEDVVRGIDRFRPLFAKAPDKALTLSMMMKPMMGTGGGMHMMHGGSAMPHAMMQMGEPKKIEWEDDMGMMNANSTKDTLVWQITDNQTNKTNMDIDWKFKVGDQVKIKIFNDPTSMHPMQHPIHFHGQRFLVLSTNGVPNTNLVWKDTALIQTGDTVELLVDISNPGEWMVHCHIPEHLEAGMMFGFQVDEV